jgi:hypothetical protein
MTHVVLRRVGGVLVPADEESARFVALLADGEGVGIDVHVTRSPDFHRRLMKLIRVGFDALDPIVPEDTVGPVHAYEKFREDSLILAGHCSSEMAPDGTLRLRARSIAFDNCDQIEAESVYRRVLDVIWSRVLRWSRYASVQDVEAVVDKLLEFE